MNTFKKILHSHFPSVYYALRDVYQFTRFRFEGSLQSVQLENQQAQSDAEIYRIAEKWIPPHQVKSEILGLIQSIRELQPANFVEIGTANGGTHFLIRRMCPSIRYSVAMDIDIRNKFLIDRLTTTDKVDYLLGESCSPATVRKFSRIYGGEQQG